MTTKYGIIGVGTISTCLVQGLMNSDHAPSGSEAIILSPRGSSNGKALCADFPGKVRMVSSNQAVLDEAGIIFLGVLPEQVESTLSALTFLPTHRLISMVSTATLDDLEKYADPLPRCNIVRTIPMPAMRRLQGTTLICLAVEDIVELFNHLGTVVPVEEESAFGRLIALTCLQGDMYNRLAVMQKWLTESKIPGETATSFISALFNTIMSDIKHPQQSDIFQVMVEEQTPGAFLF